MKYLIFMLWPLATTLGHYTNEWAVTVHEGQSIDEVAQASGCEVSHPIFSDTFLLTCHRISKRSTGAHFHADIERHPNVAEAEQQRVLSRKKRQLWPPQMLRRPPHPRGPQNYPPQDHYEDLLHLNDQR